VEQNQDLPHSVALEVNGDGQLRSILGHWFHGEVHGRPDLPVDAVEAPRPWRIDACDRRSGQPVGPADPPGGPAPCSDLRGAGLVPMTVHDTVLPLGEPGGVGRAVEDFHCGTVDLGAGRDRREQSLPPSLNRAASSPNLYSAPGKDKQEGPGEKDDSGQALQTGLLDLSEGHPGDPDHGQESHQGVRKWVTAHPVVVTLAGSSWGQMNWTRMNRNPATIAESRRRGSALLW